MKKAVKKSSKDLVILTISRGEMEDIAWDRVWKKYWWIGIRCLVTLTVMFGLLYLFPGGLGVWGKLGIYAVVVAIVWGFTWRAYHEHYKEQLKTLDGEFKVR